MKKIIDKAIGERIRVARKAAGVTQEELAAAAGFAHKTSINKIELGVYGVPDDKLQAIADTLHVSAEYLTTGLVTPDGPAPLSGWADALVKAATELTAPRRSELLEFTAFLAAAEGHDNSEVLRYVLHKPATAAKPTQPEQHNVEFVVTGSKKKQKVYATYTPDSSPERPGKAKKEETSVN